MHRGSLRITFGFMALILDVHEYRKTPQIQIGSTRIILLACRGYSKRSTPVDHSDGQLHVSNEISPQDGRISVDGISVGQVLRID